MSENKHFNHVTLTYDLDLWTST